MPEKKRKRADAPSCPDPTVDISTPRADIRVSSLISPKLSPPVIATAPGLSLPEAVQFRSYGLFSDAGGRKSCSSAPANLLLRSSGHRSLDYTGREEHYRDGHGLLRHYIGIFDPKTGALEVIEARKVTVRGSVRSQKAPSQVGGALGEHQTSTDLRAELGQAFGTKKARKALVAKVENAIAPRNHDTNQGVDAGEAALMASIRDAAADMPTREQLQAAVDLAKPVPKGNYDATEVQDVYDPDQIIGSDVLSAVPIRDWQEAIGSGEPVHSLSRFVASRLRRVGEHEDSAKRLRILRYLYFLILLLIHSKSGGRGARKIPPKDRLRAELKPAPDVVLDSLKKKFTDNGEMRKPHVDLAMTTCCVLASIIDSFEVDTQELREDLRLDQKQLSQYFHEIGARTRLVKTGDRSTVIAKLVLPLEFPKLRMQKRR